MITLDKNNQEKHLLIGGQKIHPIEDGLYIVPYDALLSEDLSRLPAGTILEIDYQGKEGRTPAELIIIRRIEVLSNGRVRVTADHYRCSCCWRHALSFQKYTEIVMKTFKEQHNRNTGFIYDTVEFNDEAEPFHIFSLELDNGAFNDIEQRVNIVAMQFLKPLLDFRDSIDAQILQQFGV